VKYAVGQIIYVVLKKETRVYPMQVIEEITKKTFEGELTSYVVSGGDPKVRLSIADIDGEVFDSADKAKKMLIERATSNIVRLVDIAVQKAKEWYPGSFEAPSDDQVALFKKQPSAQQAASRSQAAGRAGGKRQLAELAAELQQESSEIAADDNLVLVGPEGQQTKIRTVKLPDNMS
jgi:hypothetical protein